MDTTTPSSHATTITGATSAQEIAPAQKTSEEASPTHTSHNTHTLYSFRFVVAIAVFFGNFGNSAVWATYASVTPSAAAYVGGGAWQINLLSLFFQVAFIIFIALGTWVVDVYGLKPAVLIGCWGTAVGALIRWLSHYAPLEQRFAIMSTGQMIAAVAQPFLLETPTKAAALWFGEKERLTANTVMSLGQPIGTAVILVLAPSIVNGDPNQINLLNLIVLGIVAALAIFATFTVRSKPLTPPSKSAERESLPFWEGVKSLAGNRSFWIVWIVFGMLIGAFNVYVTLISDYVTPQGYTESDAGNVGLASIAAGLVSAAIVGPVLDRTRSHRTVFRYLPILGAIGVVLFFLGAGWSDRLGVLFAGAILIGASGFPVMPLSLELGVECTFPVAEGTSSGMLWTSGQAWGIVGLLVSNAVRGQDASMRSSIGVLIGMLGVAVLVAPFYYARSRRMAIDFEAEVVVKGDGEGVLNVDAGAGENDGAVVEVGEKKV
ncbi:major facilitator superfamily domain-containing protein [Chytridium lagenaria]|nr:major facilitator superfamily domain-containing protein [Chytridium lagenaria]